MPCAIRTLRGVSVTPREARFCRYCAVPSDTLRPTMKGSGIHARTPAAVLPCSYAAVWPGSNGRSGPRSSSVSASPPSYPAIAPTMPPIRPAPALARGCGIGRAPVARAPAIKPPNAPVCGRISRLTPSPNEPGPIGLPSVSTANRLMICSSVRPRRAGGRSRNCGFKSNRRAVPSRKLS